MDNYTFDYRNKNEFDKVTKGLKKCGVLAYKKILFEYCPSLKKGNFLGKLIFADKKGNIRKYELVLPTEPYFAKVYDELVLHYTVFMNEKVIMLDTITPEEVLMNASPDMYKGVLGGEIKKETNMFKINLLDMMQK